MRNRRYFHRRIRVDIDISSSSFDRSETRVIFIGEYVWKNKRSSSSFDCSETRVSFIEEYVSTLIPVHPTSIASALFSSKNTCGSIQEVHPAPIAVKHALFPSNNTCGRIKEVHPASIAVKHALFSSKKITRVSLESKLDESMSLSTCISRVNVCSNDTSSSRFDCSESRVIFINR